MQNDVLYTQLGEVSAILWFDVVLPWRDAIRGNGGGSAKSAGLGPS